MDETYAFAKSAVKLYGFPLAAAGFGGGGKACPGAAGALFRNCSGRVPDFAASGLMVTVGGGCVSRNSTMVTRRFLALAGSFGASGSVSARPTTRSTRSAGTPELKSVRRVAKALSAESSQLE